jgi:hypothetical protein
VAQSRKERAHRGEPNPQAILDLNLARHKLRLAFKDPEEVLPEVAGRSRRARRNESVRLRVNLVPRMENLAGYVLRNLERDGLLHIVHPLHLRCTRTQW